MSRCQPSCLRAWSRPEPRGVEGNQGGPRRSLVQSRQTTEGAAKGEVRGAGPALTLEERWKEEFARREKVGRSRPRLAEDPHNKMRGTRSGPSLTDVSLAVQESQHRLTVTRERRDRVLQQLSSLQEQLEQLKSIAEAVDSENLDLHDCHEQEEAEAILSPETLETVDPVQHGSGSASVEPDVIDCVAKIDAVHQNVQASSVRQCLTMKLESLDRMHERLSILKEEMKKVKSLAQTVKCEPVDWDARIDAAHRKFQASSARLHQAVSQFDQFLIEPTREKYRNRVLPPKDSCNGDERDEAQYRVRPQLHVARKVVAPVVISTEESKDAIASVEYATALVSDVISTESTTESDAVSATGDHTAASARLDAARQKIRASGTRVRQSLEQFHQGLRAMGATSLKQVTSLFTHERPESA